MYIFLAFISGMLVILSSIINSHLSSNIGVFRSCRMNFFVGVISITFILFFSRNLSKEVFFNLSHYPYWIYLGGIMGVLIVSITNLIILKIPTIYSTLMIFIGQVFTGIIIDYMIQRDFSLGKLVGGTLILLGLLYNFRIDKSQSSLEVQ